MARWTYDPTVRGLYIYLMEGVKPERKQALDEGVILDMLGDLVIGVEIILPPPIVELVGGPMVRSLSAEQLAATYRVHGRALSEIAVELGSRIESLKQLDPPEEEDGEPLAEVLVSLVEAQAVARHAAAWSLSRGRIR